MSSIDWHLRAQALSIDPRPVVAGQRRVLGQVPEFETRDPHRDKAVARYPRCGGHEVDEAVALARASLDAARGSDWSSVLHRAEVLRRWADRIDAHAEELALLDTLEMGAPIVQSRPDVTDAAAGLRALADLRPALDDAVLTATGANRAINRRRPHGVVALVTPWNFPLYVALGKLGPALLAGNAVLLKPSEVAPASCLRLADLAREAGVPDGVLSVLTGLGSEVGAALAEHPGIEALSFTGSTATGQRIMAAAAGNLKALMLECGGKSPQIVLDDGGDCGALAAALVHGFTWNSGQVCVAGSRLLVRRAIADPLLEAVAKLVERWRTGDPLDEATRAGPLAGAAHCARVRSAVASALARSARVLARSAATSDDGCHVPAVLLGDVGPNDPIVQQEVFGPVATWQLFDTVDEAIALANATPFGLSAVVWGGSEPDRLRLAERVDAGTLLLHARPDAQASMSPLGAAEPSRASGFGVEGGREGLLAYTRAQHLSLAA